MKKIVITLIAVCLLPALSQAQSAFKKLENSDKIGTVTINKGMLGIVASMSADDADEETREFVELAKSIEGIKVFVSEDSDASKMMKSTAKGYIKTSRMESLMKVRDGDAQVDFFVKEGKDSDHVSEMVMLVTDMEKTAKGADFETVLVSMTGDIDLTKIGSLVNKMNLPKDLKKAEKKK